MKKTAKNVCFLTILSLLCVVCLLGNSPKVEATGDVASGTCGNNLTWILDETGTLTVSGNGDMVDFAFGEMPWYDYISQIQKVVIEDGVTGIGSMAFYGNFALTDITLGKDVARIGDSAFAVCDALKSVTIPGNVKVIGAWAFSECYNLETVVILDGVVTIEDSAFWDCAALTALSLPDSVTSVGSNAFLFCHGMTELEIGSGLVDLDMISLNYCSKLQRIDVDPENPVYSSDASGVLFNKDKTVLLRAPNKLLGKYTVPDGVIEISANAFFRNEGLQEVVLPDSVTTLGNCAMGYSRLEKVTLGNGLLTIDEVAFRYCDKLTSIVIPDSVISIGEYAFQGCTQLETAHLGSSVQQIGSNAFNACKQLKTINFPDSLTSVGEAVLNDCTALEYISLPFLGDSKENATHTTEKLIYLFTIYYNKGEAARYVPASLKEVAFTGETIPADAFQNCSMITTLHLGENVKEIGKNAFGGCTGLKDVYFGGTQEQAEELEISSDNSLLQSAAWHYAQKIQYMKNGEMEIFESLEDAVAAANGGYIRLTGDVIETIVISNTIGLDLNGFTVTGDICVEEDGVLYLFDSKTSDYNADDRGWVDGEITGNIVRSFNATDIGAENHRYLVLRETDGRWSSHRYYLAVRSALLLPYLEDYGTGLNYKTEFKCNEILASYVCQYGVKLTGDNTVYADYMRGNNRLLYGAENTNVGSTLLSGVMKLENSTAVNAANAERTPIAQGYIVLCDELEVTSAAAQVSAKELICAAVEREDLTEKQKRSLGEMYAAFGEVLDTWTDMDVDILHQYMQTYTSQTFAWTPQDSKKRA